MANFTGYYKTETDPTIYGVAEGGQRVGFQDPTQLAQAQGLGTADFSQVQTDPSFNPEGSMLYPDYLKSQSATPAPTNATFYKPETPQPGFAPETVFNEKGEGLSYEDYIQQGGKSDFSNVQAGFAKAVQSGQPVPETQGEANTALKALTPVAPKPVQPTPLSGIESLLAEDKGYQQLLANQKLFNDTITQRASLADEYKALIKESGVAEINTELLDMKNLLEGQEDAVREEITKTGGWASEQQVQLLTQSRNKVLIKNYQNLLDTKNSLMETVNTMIGLAGQDRQFAMQAISQKMNLDNQLIQYRDNMQQKAVEQYKYIADKMGFDGLLAQTGNDPYYVSLIEKTLGLGEDGLTQLANQAIEERALKQEEQSLKIEGLRSGLKTDVLQRQTLKSGLETDVLQRAKLQSDIEIAKQETPLNLALKKAQIANIYSDIAKRNSEGTIMVDQYGKVVPKQEEAMKINKELVNSDAYKAITKAKDSLQYLKTFEDTFNKTGSTSAVFSPRQNAALKAKYNTAILNLKEFFNLGVLNGPDEKILRSVLPDPTSRSAVLTGLSLGIYKPSAGTRAGIDNMKKMIETSLDDRYKSLSSQYGDYSSSSVNGIGDLNRVYVEQKGKLNPEISKMLKDNPNLTYEDIIQVITQ